MDFEETRLIRRFEKTKVEVSHVALAALILASVEGTSFEVPPDQPPGRKFIRIKFPADQSNAVLWCIEKFFSRTAEVNLSKYLKINRDIRDALNGRSASI